VLKTLPFRALLFLLFSGTAMTVQALAQGLDVTATVNVTRERTHSPDASGSAGVVVWLTPVDPANAVSPKPGHYRLTQKDKQFTPHLMVIPTGSTVDFPNLDPFFHNVFSLFNGKRFDLGLYESGSTRAVHFNHDGISYIFCNIHPEMSAVVVTLPTPYYGVTSPTGAVSLPAVPPGTYQLHVWAEGANSEELLALSRRVVVSASARDLGTIQVKVDTHPEPHKNKFGEDYQAPDESTY
jgi:plastocyanin